ncbi:hypothetical protein [Deinococcus roseus]|uniref:hypothetical protein n=1 Tax=Deinococcus roseus TaxID=392414 RepID=UPI001889DF80|nr:hypothetical protein [Deinococcus roseus]
MWAAVLWWYTLELPKWLGFIRNAGLTPSPELQNVLFLHPYAGVLLGAIVLLFSLLLSRGRSLSTSVNLQFLSTFVALLALGWVMWGVYQSAKNAMPHLSIF